MSRAAQIAVTALALALVAIAVYWDAHDNEFVWDDPIVFERQLPYFDSAKNIFLPPPSIPQFGTHYYRPTIVLTYLLDEKLAAAFWDDEERLTARQIVYHTSCIVYHALATVLVFLLGLVVHDAAGLRRDDPFRLWASAAAGLLFAVHPIHVESVAWMAGRSDVICGIFFLAATICLLLHARKGGVPLAVLAGVCALGAMLSKETGVGLALLAPLIVLLVRGETAAADVDAQREAKLDRAERRRRDRAAHSVAAHHVSLRWLSLVTIAGATALYFALRNAAIESMRSPAFGQVMEAAKTTLAQKIEILLEVVAFYAVKTIWPLPQSAFIPEGPSGPLWILIGIATGAGFLALLALGRSRGASGWARESLVGALFITALAPSLAIAVFKISETPIAERYLYIPSAGACLLAAFVFARLVSAWTTRAAASERTVARAALLPMAIAAVIAVPASLATMARVDVWATDLAFWEDTVAKAPDQGLPHLHLGIRLSQLERFDEALASYERALETYDDIEGRTKALNNSASLHVRLGNYEHAIDLCRRALEMDATYPTPYYNWALAALSLGERETTTEARRARLAEALEKLQAAVKLNPRYTKARYQLGRILAQLGRNDLAMEHLRVAAQIDPTSAEGRGAAALIERLRASGG